MSDERDGGDVSLGSETELRDAIEAAARAVGEAAKATGRKVTVAESCTGGLVCAALTGVPGISSSFERGFVTYANEAKAGMLGVPADLIARVGAVSAEVAAAMARGALERSGADAAVAVTGVAGPGGGTPDKPVGLVHFAVATASGVVGAERRYGDLGRRAVRERSVLRALRMLGEAVRG